MFARSLYDLTGIVHLSWICGAVETRDAAKRRTPEEMINVKRPETDRTVGHWYLPKRVKKQSLL